MIVIRPRSWHPKVKVVQRVAKPTRSFSQKVERQEKAKKVRRQAKVVVMVTFVVTCRKSDQSTVINAPFNSESSMFLELRREPALGRCC